MAYAQSPRAQCDLGVEVSDMVRACEDNYLCQMSLKSHHAGQSYGSDRGVITIAYAQSPRAQCHLGLEVSGMVRARKDNCLCQMSLNPDHAGQTNGSDMSVSHSSICTKSMSPV